MDDVTQVHRVLPAGTTREVSGTIAELRVIALNLLEDGQTCLDVEVEVDGKREIWHILGHLDAKERFQAATGVSPDISIVRPEEE